MIGYAYMPASDNPIDIEICNKKNEIEKLREEISELEKKKSLENTQYIGRCFEMTDYSYMYVTHFGIDRKMYGLCFDINECDIEVCATEFNPSQIEKEIDMRRIKSEIRDVISVDKLLEILMVE